MIYFSWSTLLNRILILFGYLIYTKYIFIVTAFFTFLRANLALPASPSNSTLSTPYLDASSSQSLPPLGPSSLTTMTNVDSCNFHFSSSSSSTSSSFSASPSTTDSVHSFPSSATSFSGDDGWFRGDDEVTTEVLWMDRDKDIALDLIRQSVVEQRTEAFKAVVGHPLVIVWWTLLSAVMWKLGAYMGCDSTIIMSAVASITAVSIATLWFSLHEYASLAARIDQDWLRLGDTILGARHRDKLIGTAIIRLENSTPRNRRRRTNGKGFVTAWTVQKQQRRKGVGRQILEEAVRTLRDRAGNGVDIGFAAEHANSVFVLPELFVKRFRMNERMAATVLDGVMESKRFGAWRGGSRRGLKK